MSDTVRDLVDAMVQGDALGTEKAFSAAMAEKLSSKLDDMRMDVAKNMFATEQEQIDLSPVEDDMDLDEVESELESEEEVEEDE